MSLYITYINCVEKKDVEQKKHTLIQNVANMK